MAPLDPDLMEPKVDAVRQRLYDSYVDSQYGWLNDLSEEGLERSIRHLTQRLVPHLPPEREARILDIGCGSGALLAAARRAGYASLTGIDASAQQVELCRGLGFDAVCSGGAEFLRRTPASFDAIVMSDVLEHMTKEYAIEVLELCAQRLRPGGRVVIKVPNMSNPLNLRTRYADLTHGIGFTIESLGQALRATGFEVATIEGDYRVDERWWIRWPFDRLLWWAFRVFVRKTLHLPFPIERGKNLIAVGLKRPSEALGGGSGVEAAAATREGAP